MKLPNISDALFFFIFLIGVCLTESYFLDKTVGYEYKRKIKVKNNRQYDTAFFMINFDNEIIDFMNYNNYHDLRFKTNITDSKWDTELKFWPQTKTDTSVNILIEYKEIVHVGEEVEFYAYFGYRNPIAFEQTIYDLENLLECEENWIPNGECDVTTCYDHYSNETDIVCSGNGDCESLNECRCYDYYYGDNCEITSCNGVFSNSSEEICLGRGDCNKHNACDCNSSYSGSNCQYPVCNGTSSILESVCSYHGVCVSPDTCICEEGYDGNICQNYILDTTFLSNDPIDCYEHRRKITVTNTLEFETNEFLIEIDIMEIKDFIHSDDFFDLRFKRKPQDIAWLTELRFWIEGSFKDYVDEYNDYELSNVNVWIDYPENVGVGESVEFYMYFGCETEVSKQKAEYDWDGNFYLFTNWDADCNNWHQTLDMNGYFLKDDGTNEWGYTNAEPNEKLPFHYRPISDGEMTEKASEFPLYGERIAIKDWSLYPVWDNAVSHEHKHHVSYLLEHDEFPEYIERTLCYSHNLRLKQGHLLPSIGEFDTELYYRNFPIYRMNKYMKAATHYNNEPSDSSTTGGAHIHHYENNISFASQDYIEYGLKYQQYVGGMDNITRWYHYHNLSFTTDEDNTQTLNPEALKTFICINQRTHNEIHPEMIFMIDKEPPLGWNKFTTSDDKYLISSFREEMLEEYGSKYHHHYTSTSFQTPNDFLYLDDYVIAKIFTGLENYSISGYPHRHMFYPNKTQPEARNELPYYNVKYYTRKYLKIDYSIGEIEDLLLCKDKYFPYGVCDITVCYNISSNETSVCSGRGTCTSPNTCVCQENTYDGDNCEYAICNGISASNESVCSGKGTCSSPNTCVCEEGYNGDDCEYAICNGISASDESVCSGRGNCTFPDTCVCQENTYGGDDCEYPFCFGLLSNNETVCSGNGECISPNNCNCTEGFTGNECEEEI